MNIEALNESAPRLRWRRLLILISGAAAFCLSIAGTARAQAPSTSGAHSGVRSMELDRTIRSFFLTDLLEFVPSPRDNSIRLDGLGWIGGDYNRLLLRAEGDQPTARGRGSWQLDAFYGRLVSPFWTAAVGARLDTRAVGGRRATRGLLALGFEGLAPYWFEMEPTLFVSQSGDVSAQLTSSVDVLITQRLILQPRVEMNAAVQSVPTFGIGSGLNDFELGARVRYEFRRELAPYVGVSWLRRTGATASMARRDDLPVSDLSFVVGMRLWH